MLPKTKLKLKFLGRYGSWIFILQKSALKITDSAFNY